MTVNGRTPRHVSTADAAGKEEAEAMLDDVLHPSTNTITNALGFPLLPVVIGYGFLLYVAVAMLASMATFHETQVMVVGGKIYLVAVALSLLFSIGGWIADSIAQGARTPPADDPAMDDTNAAS